MGLINLLLGEKPMNNELIQHLLETKNAIENDVLNSLPDRDKIQNYLYFATQVERMSLYMAEKSSNGVMRPSRVPRDFGKEQDFELYRLKPVFEAEAKNKGLVSISDKPLEIDPTFKNALAKLRAHLYQIEQNKGIFDALLELKNQAHYDDDTDGGLLRGRVAASYLQIVAANLDRLFSVNTNLLVFLDWYGKRDRILIENGSNKSSEVKEWKFTKKELKSPPESARPIHEIETAPYIKYFLEKSVNSFSRRTSQYAQMSIFLPLSLAVARSRSNYYQPCEILNISSKNLVMLPPIKGIAHVNYTELISPQWILSGQGIRIDEHIVIVSPKLALAIKLLGFFTIEIKDVANQLTEAFQEVGLSQSSGKICPRCFTFGSHSWKNVDTRK